MTQRQRKRTGFQDWCTPKEVIEPLNAFLPITLDPCSNARSIVPAAVRISLPDDGLGVRWCEYGHTYCNPPYENQAPWLLKCAVEYTIFDALAITALVPAATETTAFREFVFGTAEAIAFWHKRVVFIGPKGKHRGNTLPSALCYWGNEPERFYHHFSPYATVVLRRGWDIECVM